MNKLMDQLETDYQKMKETDIPTDDSSRKVSSLVDHKLLSADNLTKHKELCKKYFQETINITTTTVDNIDVEV